MTRARVTNARGNHHYQVSEKFFEETNAANEAKKKHETRVKEMNKLLNNKTAEFNEAARTYANHTYNHTHTARSIEMEKKLAEAQQALNEMDDWRRVLNKPQSISVPENKTTARLYYFAPNDKFELKINEETTLKLDPEFVKAALELNEEKQKEVNRMTRGHENYSKWLQGLPGGSLRAGHVPHYTGNINFLTTRRQNLGNIKVTPNILQKAINVHNNKNKAKKKLKLAEQVNLLKQMLNTHREKERILKEKLNEKRKAKENAENKLSSARKNQRNTLNEVIQLVNEKGKEVQPHHLFFKRTGIDPVTYKRIRENPIPALYREPRDIDRIIRTFTHSRIRPAEKNTKKTRGIGRFSRTARVLPVNNKGKKLKN